MLTIGDLSRLNARRYANKTALVMGEQTLSYAELDAQSNQIAHAALSAGIVPGDRIAILALNSIEYAIVLQAIAKCGAMVVPINFRCSAADLRHVLSDSEPKLLFLDAAFAPLVSAACGERDCPKLIYMGSGAPAPATYIDALRHEYPATDPGITVDPQSSAVILYTSGTTGRPKGVLFSHATYVRMFLATAIETHLVHEDVYLIAVPMFHAAGMNMVLNQCLFMGSTGIVHRGRFEPDVILGLIAQHGITVTILVPTQVGVLAFHPELARYDVRTLRTLFYGSMPITAQVLAHARKVLPNVRFNQLYGSTECGMVTALRHEDHEQWSQTVGREALMSRYRVVDEQGADVPVGGVGEVLSEQRRMGMIGYWRNDAATQETIQNGWIRSGDLARVEPEGFLTLVDRLKDVIISGGENIYPKEIENVLAAHPAVQEVAVFGIPDSHYGEAVCAAVAFKPGQSTSVEELDALCTAELARFKRPKRFEFHEALPRNANDKVQKPLLRAPHWKKA